MILDLNAKRAERAKNRGDGMQMLLGDETFDLVDELPLEIGELANEQRIGDALRIMLRNPDEDWDRLKKCRPSFNDVLDVVAYFGTALGESVGPTGNSANTGRHLKPISIDTTDVPSGTTVTAIDRSTPDGLSPTSETSLPTPRFDAS